MKKDKDDIFKSLYGIILEGQQKKIFRDDIHPKILAFLIVGMLNWFYQWYRFDGPRGIEKIIDDVMHLVFDGVLVKHP
jgi:hypothetical protein